MAATVYTFNAARLAALYGAIQKLNTVAFQARNPFYVTLRSVAGSTTSSAGDYPLQNRATGTLNGVGTNELSTANGYTTGGKALENVALSYSAGVLTMKADNVRWIASGAGIAARSALLCYELPASRVYASWSYNQPYSASLAIASIDFDGLYTASAGLSFLIKWPAAGILQWRMT